MKLSQAQFKELFSVFYPLMPRASSTAKATADYLASFEDLNEALHSTSLFDGRSFDVFAIFEENQANLKKLAPYFFQAPIEGGEVRRRNVYQLYKRYFALSAQLKKLLAMHQRYERPDPGLLQRRKKIFDELCDLKARLLHEHQLDDDYCTEMHDFCRNESRATLVWKGLAYQRSILMRYYQNLQKLFDCLSECVPGRIFILDKVLKKLSGIIEEIKADQAFLAVNRVCKNTFAEFIADLELFFGLDGGSLTGDDSEYESGDEASEHAAQVYDFQQGDDSDYDSGEDEWAPGYKP